MQVAALPPAHRSLTLSGVLPLAWLVLITVPLARAAAETLAHSDYLGASQAIPTFQAIAIFTALGLIIGSMRWQRLSRLYACTLLTVASVVGAAALIASRAAADVVVVLWLVLLGWALGDRLLRVLFGRMSAPRGTERAMFSIALALGFYSHATLGLALLGVLYRSLAVALLVLLSLVLWRDLRDKARLALRLRSVLAGVVNRPTERWFTLPLLALLSSWTLLVLIEAVVPEIQYDSLNYHLALPKLYIEQHRFVLTPYHLQSWFALGTEMDYLLAMLLVGQVAAKFIHFTFLMLTVGTIFTFGKQCFSERAGLLAAALYATTPLVAWEASTSYVDLAVACYCFLAVVAAYRWLVDRRPAWLAVAGLLAGFALSSKLNAVFCLVPLGVLVTLAALTDRRPALTRRWLPLLSFGGAALLSGAPWPALRYVQTGNPVFPLLNGVFRSPLWPPVNETLNFWLFGIGISPDALLRLPWEVTFSSEKFIEAMPASVLGLGLLALPLLVFCRTLPRVALYLAALLLAFSAAWASTVQYLRYALPALPVLYLLVGHALATIGERPGLGSARRTRAGAAGLIALIWIMLGLPLFVATYWNIPERIPYPVAFGLESREQYLSRVITTYDAYQSINKNYSSNVHILSLSPEETRLFSSGIVETQHSPLLRARLYTNDATELLKLIRDRGFTHLLVNRNRLADYFKGLLLVQRPFLDAHTELVYARNNVLVYRFLTEDEEATRPAKSAGEQLVADPGFEELDRTLPMGWQAYGRPKLDASGQRSHSGRVAVQVSTDSGYIQSVPITPGRIYSLSHYSRSDTPDSSVRVQVNWVDEENTIVEASIDVFGAASDWTQHELIATAPPGAKRAVIFANAHSGQVWVDDYSFVAVGGAPLIEAAVSAEPPVGPATAPETARRAPLTVRELHPSSTQVGQVFNPQPDGQAALSVDCENAPPGTVIVFGGTPLATTYGSHGWLTAIVPGELYSQPGRYEVSLKNDTSESSPVEFEVVP